MVEDKDVEGLRRGDRVCFENIFNRYSPDLYVVAYRITGNKAVAEDGCPGFFREVVDEPGKSADI